jgi:hypothetical protein
VRVLERIANWIDFGVSLLCAVFLALFVVEFQAGRILASSATVRTHKTAVIVACIVVAALLFLGAVLRACLAIARSDQGRYLIYETPNGRVSIRAASVAQALNRAVRTVTEVADARIELAIPKGSNQPIEVRVRCRLYDRPNLLASQDRIRACVRARYRELFPGEEDLPVQVLVEHILFEAPGPKPLPLPRPGAAGSEEESEPGPPLRPQYPVG